MGTDETQAGPLRTARLHVRALAGDDGAAVAAVYGDAETMVTMPWRLLADPHAVHAWLEARLGEARTGSPGYFVVFDHTAAVVGLCGFIPRDERLEIGWAIRHPHWGRGYASEAAAAVLAQAGDASVFAAIRPGNAASIRVAEKIGLRLEAETHDEYGTILRYGRGPMVDVRDTGAAGDGTHLDTVAVQRAIDAVAERDGVVRVSRGSYRIGSIALASGVTLRIEADAMLLASTEPSDFFPVEEMHYATHADVETSDFRHALLVGDGLHGVTITGGGAIDMQRERRFGPKPIALRRCTNVEVSDIMIRNAPNYCVSLLGCDDVLVERVTIRDAFSDGVDPDSCRRVQVRDCDVESDDDALCIKTSLALGEPRACEDVTVTGCRLSSPSNAFKIGTETSGDVRHVEVRNCRLGGLPRPGADPDGLVLAQEGGGIAIESVDGAHVSDVSVRDVTVDGCSVPVLVRLGARGRGHHDPTPGTIRRVTIERLRVAGATDACTISGIPGHRVEQIAMSDVSLAVAPANPPPTAPVPEQIADYPQAGMFGALPSAAVYARHVDGLLLRDVRVAVTVDDPRPWLVTDDVGGLAIEAPLTR
jgi:RimJ/RimL family protein N-acetyltransferase